MLNTKKIAVIGYGVMGEAIISGLIKIGGIPPQSITTSGPREERRQDLIERYGIHSVKDNTQVVSGSDVVFLAVKPQKIHAVIKGLKGKIPPNSVVISIIAGVSMDLLVKTLGHEAIVRAMPNTPARIGDGITVWTNSRQVSPEQKDMARESLQCLGKELFVEEESYLDMATALSGTGPAYVFLFMEALIDAGVHMGFPRRIAEELVVQTLQGSVAYYKSVSEHPAAMRNQVTSPGGTSAEALYYLEKAGFRTAISRAVWAAYQRSLDLGAGHSRLMKESETE
ncbi:MAG: pyrroline-5-carboxylate reductase [Anaerolinea sp.]|nr:pyrroline-5-carboxylate reductase [Anaerolinea sp.]